MKIIKEIIFLITEYYFYEGGRTIFVSKDINKAVDQYDELLKKLDSYNGLKLEAFECNKSYESLDWSDGESPKMIIHTVKNFNGKLEVKEDNLCDWKKDWKNRLKVL